MRESCSLVFRSSDKEEAAAHEISNHFPEVVCSEKICYQKPGSDRRKIRALVVETNNYLPRSISLLPGTQPPCYSVLTSQWNMNRNYMCRFQSWPLKSSCVCFSMLSYLLPFGCKQSLSPNVLVTLQMEGDWVLE